MQTPTVTPAETSNLFSIIFERLTPFGWEDFAIAQFTDRDQFVTNFVSAVTKLVERNGPCQMWDGLAVGVEYRIRTEDVFCPMIAQKLADAPRLERERVASLRARGMHKLADMVEVWFIPYNGAVPHRRPG